MLHGTVFSKKVPLVAEGKNNFIPGDVIDITAK
jgi:hypothetical protein